MTNDDQQPLSVEQINEKFQLLGKSRYDANVEVMKSGYGICVVFDETNPKTMYIKTADIDYSRINVWIKDGKISKVEGVG